jgi:imidazolonepropionase-like amidohydrolase
MIFLRLPFIAMGALGAASILAAFGQTAPAGPGAGVVLIKAGRLLDVKEGRYLADQGILVEKDRIKEVGSFASIKAHAPKEASLVDLGKAAVLPGLIDCHAHLLDAMEPRWRSGEAILLTTSMSPSRRALLGARMARETLEGGVTSVRNVGHAGPEGDVDLRDAVEAGWVPGPRIAAATRKISPPGGQAVMMRSEIARAAVAQDYIGIGTPDEGRRAVRDDLAAGADLIKVVVDDENRSLSLEDLKAIVEEAHRAKVKVAAHATSEPAIRAAVEAGVDSVEHGTDAGDETLKMMHDKGIFLVETVLWSAARFIEFRSAVLTVTPEDRTEIETYFKDDAAKGKDRLKRAMAAGVKIAAGSDMWFLYRGKTRGQATLLELEGLVEEGMTAADALRAATVNAAELLGWQADVGSLEAGKYADVIALPGDPMEKMSDLQDVRFVMKGGVVIKNQLASP